MRMILLAILAFHAAYPLPATEGTGTVSGEMKYSCYEGRWDRMPDFDALKPSRTGTCSGFDIPPDAGETHFGCRFEGSLTLESDNTWGFSLKSDSGSRLYVDGILVVDNGNPLPGREKTATALLSRGVHALRLDYHHGEGKALLEVKYSPLHLNAWKTIPVKGPVDPAPPHWFVDARFGMFIHWGPYVHSMGKTISWSRTTEIPPEVYDRYYLQFNPKDYDAEQIVRFAVDAGMKYLVMVAKHHDGFCMWDASDTDYNIMHSPIRRDLIGEMAQACRKGGIRFGVYYSVADWKHPDFHDEKRNPAAGKNIKVYVEYLKAQMTELVENYDPDLVFYDWSMGGQWKFEFGKEVNEHLRRIKPGLIMNNRAHGETRSFQTVESRVGSFDRGRPWESCITPSPQWSWHPERTIKSTREVLENLVYTACGDGNLLLNVTPDPLGVLEKDERDQLREIGEWMKRYGGAVLGTRGGPFLPEEGFGSTCRDDRIHLFLLENPREGRLELPIPGEKVLSIEPMGKGTVSLERNRDSVHLTVKEWPSDEGLMVLEMKVDGYAPGMVPATVPSRSLLFGKRITASSVRGTDLAADRATDDLKETRWAAQKAGREEWLEVDLGEIRAINEVSVLAQMGKRDKLPLRLEIRTEEDASWKTLFKADARAHHWTKKSFPPERARHIRLFFPPSKVTPSICEFRIWETGTK